MNGILQLNCCDEKETENQYLESFSNIINIEYGIFEELFEITFTLSYSSELTGKFNFYIKTT